MMILNSLILKYQTGIQIREDIPVIRISDNEASFQKGTHSFNLRKLRSNDWKIIHLLQEGLSTVELQKTSQSSRFIHMLSVFEERGILKSCHYEKWEDPSLDRQMDWFSYFNHHPASLQKKISSFKLLILGCGGTGSIAATHLARAGFSHFVLVDGAKIDTPDLNRQIPYERSNLGQNKTDVLKNYLYRQGKISSCITVNTWLEHEFQVKNVIENNPVNLVLNCADKPIGKILPWVAKACAETNVPVLFGGVGLEQGTIGPLLTTKDAKLNFVQAMEKAGEKINGSNQVLNASTVFTNSLIATHLAFEVFRFITKISEPITLNQTVNIDFFSNTTTLRRKWGESSAYPQPPSPLSESF